MADQTDKQPKNDNLYTPMSMCIGLSLGTAIGTAMGNISLGMCMGLGIGMFFGVTMDAAGELKRAAVEEDDMEDDEE